MAHITKFKLHSMPQMFAHINRSENQVRKYGNADIDTSRSYLNQDIIHGDMTELTNRLLQVSHQKRKDLVVCCGVVITLPAELHSSDLASQNRFFNYCTEFIKQKFGEKNVVYSTIHHDETTPHIHIGFVPVTQKERKFRSKARKGETYTQERVSAKEVVTKSMLNSFHSELDQYIEQKLGQKVSILTGKTEKNISIGELKRKTSEEIKQKQELIHSIDEDIEKKSTLFNRMIIKKEDYLSLKTENLLLKNQLAKENEDLDIKNKKINTKEKELHLREMNYLSKEDARDVIEELELKNKRLMRYKSEAIYYYEENKKLNDEILKLQKENKKLKEFKDLAMNVFKYSIKVLENIRTYDFNSNALSSSLSKVKEFCFKNNLSIFNSNSRSR